METSADVSTVAVTPEIEIPANCAEFKVDTNPPTVSLLDPSPCPSPSPSASSEIPSFVSVALPSSTTETLSNVSTITPSLNVEINGDIMVRSLSVVDENSTIEEKLKTILPKTTRERALQPINENIPQTGTYTEQPSLSNNTKVTRRPPRRVSVPYNKIAITFNKKALDRLGVSKEAIAREKILLKLGLTEDDLITSRVLWNMRQSQLLSDDSTPEEKKIQQVTGYSITQIRRAKSMRVLGTSEEIIAQEIAQLLSGLGPKNLSTDKAP